jgi:hypothetical protein
LVVGIGSTERTRSTDTNTKTKTNTSAARPSIVRARWRYPRSVKNSVVP